MFFDTIDLRDKEIYLRLYKTADENIREGYVPAYHFKIVRRADDTEVGLCDLRIGHNDNTRYGGNIGYEVYKSFRGNRYSLKACKLLFLLAKKHGMDEVILHVLRRISHPERHVNTAVLNWLVLSMCLSGIRCIKADRKEPAGM